jgi:hypothetical protein
VCCFPPGVKWPEREANHSPTFTAEVKGYLGYTNFATGIFHILNLFLHLINPLNAELNPVCHLLALAEARHFVDVSRIRVNFAYTSFILHVLQSCGTHFFHFARTSVIWHILQSFCAYFSHLAHTSVIWHILQSFCTYFSYLAPTSVILHILQSLCMYFSHLARMSVILYVLQSFGTYFSRFALTAMILHTHTHTHTHTSVILIFQRITKLFARRISSKAVWWSLDLRMLWPHFFCFFKHSNYSIFFK